MYSKLQRENFMVSVGGSLQRVPRTNDGGEEGGRGSEREPVKSAGSQSWRFLDAREQREGAITRLL